ncbi:MAG TPA: primosomal protein N', partial [Thermomicrobiales bacterium]|nr:primosomal protein N' [Thermomicrobiales bacterium]
MSDAAVSFQPDADVYAEVAVDSGRPRAAGVLTYAVPNDGGLDVEPGQLVWVPLRKKLVPGIVLRLHGEPPAFATKPVHAAAEPPTAIDPARLAAGLWLARETASSPFASLSPFLPPGRPQRVAETLHLVDPAVDRVALTPTQRRLVDLLAARGDLDLEAARAALGSSLATVVPALERLGAIERTTRVATRLARASRQRFVRLAAESEPLDHAPRQRAVIDYLAQRARRGPAGGDGLVSLADLRARTGADHAVVGALARKGLVEEIAAPPAPRAIEPSVETAIPALTPAQAAAWRSIAVALERRDPTPLLLHGVTGSGKTEIYLRAVAWCLRHGRGAIVLVPEIALASQIVRRFTARFPGAVAVLHSALSESERIAAWRGVAAGEQRIVVGPRSALFAPVADLGLIVLDEEHESAYKQDAEPRYHARALAERLAAGSGAALVLGSATPAVETFWRAETGRIGRLDLPERVGMAGDRGGGALELPPVEVVDQRLELHRGNASLLSDPLQALLARTIANREQAILLLNRRGMATVVLCKTCGATLRCPYCDIPLVFHADRGLLLCHRCDHRERPPAACPGCRG